MADGFTTKTKGMDAIRRRLKRLETMPPGYLAVAGMTGTQGLYKRRAGPSKLEARTAKKNVMIHRIQKGRGRDVVALIERRFGSISRLWLAASRTAVRTGNVSLFMSAARDVGEAMIAAIRKGVTSGELRDVTAATKKRKDREGIRPGLPPMVRTGQFLRGLVSDAVSGKPRWR